MFREKKGDSASRGLDDSYPRCTLVTYDFYLEKTAERTVNCRSVFLVFLGMYFISFKNFQPLPIGIGIGIGIIGTELALGKALAQVSDTGRSSGQVLVS